MFANIYLQFDRYNLKLQPMKTPIDPQINHYISDPKNAQHLSEMIIENGSDDDKKIEIEADGEKIELIQIGSQNQDAIQA